MADESDIDTASAKVHRDTLDRADKLATKFGDTNKGEVIAAAIVEFERLPTMRQIAAVLDVQRARPKLRRRCGRGNRRVRAA